MSIYTKLAPQIWSEITKAKRVLFHLHPSPDGDSVGSVLALAQTVAKLNKQVTIISGDSPLPATFASLPGSNLITYRNYFDINPSDFDLFFILDTSATNQISKKGKIIFPQNLVTINLDHHASNSGFAKISLIDLKSPATCQIVFLLLEQFKLTISPEVASCLLLGLYTDTGGYKYPPTSHLTFKIAAKLAKISPDFTKIIFNFENNDQPSRLKLIGLLLSQIKTYFSGRVALTSVSQKQLTASAIDPETVSSIDVANMIKAVVGWDIAISLIEGVGDRVKVSFRTRNSSQFDLSQIAVATGYGGGHNAAAGANIPFTLTKARKLVLTTIAKLHPELGQP
jgi:phosphoesterase RecJ-like protein